MFNYASRDCRNIQKNTKMQKGWNVNSTLFDIKRFVVSLSTPQLF